MMGITLLAAANADDELNAIMLGNTTQTFTDHPVSESDLTAILEAGLSTTDGSSGASVRSAIADKVGFIE